MYQFKIHPTVSLFPDMYTDGAEACYCEGLEARESDQKIQNQDSLQTCHHTE